MGKTLYTQALADRICERLQRDSLRRICSEKGMPDRGTVENWMAADEEFAARCARARELQAEHIADGMEEIEDEVRSGALDPRAASVILSSQQWRLSKIASKKYGAKVEHEHKGAVTLQLTATDEKL